ncbi:MAG TPA: hypothetical protein VIK98_00635 [Limnochordales bacterium]
MPASHVVDALRAAAAGDWAGVLPGLAALLGMTAFFLVMAVLTFRWDTREARVAAAGNV